jgi:uncharacterized membrane protein YagU involved in acid resistance
VNEDQNGERPVTTTSAASAQYSLPKSQSSSPYRGILFGGLIAGILDITSAFIDSGLQGRSPIIVLQAVASGWLGEPSFKDGLPAAGLGLVSHFLIAFGAATIYYLASRKLRFLLQKPIVSGLLYGVAIYLFMNWLVVPLSAVPFKLSHKPLALAIGLAVHMLCIGLPISLAIRGYSNRPME